MTINVALAPEGTTPAHQARAQAPIVSAAGVHDSASLARQQLPSAVPALVSVAAYHTHIPPQPKPSLPRASVAPPSSALAAQFIAQGAAESDEALAIFAPQVPTHALLPEAEYLQDLRMARGEFQAPVKATESTSAALKAATASSLEPTSAAPLKTSLTQLAAGLPNLLMVSVKRFNLFAIRGVGAYQLAMKRNEALSKALSN